MFLLLAAPLRAEQSTNDTNVDVFKQYGIPKELPKFGLSSLSQGDHIVEHVLKDVTVGEETSESSFFLVQSTDKKGNIDLRIKYFEDDIDGEGDEPTLNESNSLSSIENLTKTEYKLRQYAESFDRSTVKVTEVDERTVLVSFQYSKYALPQDIAYFRFMHVQIKVLEGQPVAMTITNSQPFEYGKYQVEQYQQAIVFDNLADGRIIVKSKVVTATGSFKSKPASLKVVVTPVAFYDDVLGTVVQDDEKLNYVSDPRILEKRVNVDRIFPFMGDLVRRQGIDLPLPYGISVAYRNQQMNFGFSSFDLGLGSLGMVNLDKDFDPDKSFAEVTAESFSLRGDVYILPFWNVYGLLGKVKVTAEIDADYTANTMNEVKDTLNSRVPGLGTGVCNTLAENGLPFCDAGRLRVPLNLDYDVVGLGTTLAVGYREYFASLNMTWAATRLEGLNDWGDTLFSAQPMLGYQFVDYRAQFLIGAEYQALDAKMTGSLGNVDALNGEFLYDIGVKLNSWAYLIGFNKQLGKHYNITALYNKGETRDAVTLSFGYRF
ncbi:hypothetical protein [Agarivorans gilvus]|nr:hypothetical protein [Agarivorans gilvus]